MREISAGTVASVNERFRERENEILSEANIDFESLFPDLTASNYELLMSEVEQATQNNESLAQFKMRIERLGESGLKLLEKVSEII